MDGVYSRDCNAMAYSSGSPQNCVGPGPAAAGHGGDKIMPSQLVLIVIVQNMLFYSFIPNAVYIYMLRGGEYNKCRHNFGALYYTLQLGKVLTKYRVVLPVQRLRLELP